MYACLLQCMHVPCRCMCALHVSPPHALGVYACTYHARAVRIWACTYGSVRTHASMVAQYSGRTVRQTERHVYACRGACVNERACRPMCSSRARGTCMTRNTGSVQRTGGTSTSGFCPMLSSSRLSSCARSTDRCTNLFCASLNFLRLVNCPVPRKERV
jgi:hypothetical protein